MPIIPELSKGRQEGYEFKASLGYIARLWLIRVIFGSWQESAD